MKEVLNFTKKDFSQRGTDRNVRKVFCILNSVLYFLKIADVRLRHHGVIGVINNETRFASVWFAQVFL